MQLQIELKMLTFFESFLLSTGERTPGAGAGAAAVRFRKPSPMSAPVVVALSAAMVTGL